MNNRWQVLALLFSVRMAMAFQFQAVAALSPLMIREFGLDIADIGLLIGLYLSPGIVLAYPGGKIGDRFGDKPAVLFGLFLMICGGVAVVLSPDWSVQIGGRLLAGTGAIILNVVMSKMVTDWFSGREIATAMGIFVNSWPAGIALALVVLPLIAEATSLTVAMLFVVALAMAGLVLLAALYSTPETDAPSSQGKRIRLQGAALAAVLTAGLIWGLYNGALAMIFGFGPLLLAERGWSDTAASSATSIALWLVTISIPIGGIIADRTGRAISIQAAGFVLFAAALVLASRSGQTLLMFAILGIVAGISAGPIMSLPSRVLSAETRAVGMGIFFTVFYVISLLTPLAAGILARAAGTVQATFNFGVAMLVVCCAALWLFSRLARSEGSSD